MAHQIKGTFGIRLAGAYDVDINKVVIENI